jgi:hypothetical protein
MTDAPAPAAAAAMPKMGASQARIVEIDLAAPRLNAN